MPAHRYVEENSLAAILATMMAGVTPEVNLIEYVTHTPPPNMNKATHFGFETQRRHHQKSKKGFQWPHKRTKSNLFLAMRAMIHQPFEHHTPVFLHNYTKLAMLVDLSFLCFSLSFIFLYFS